MAAPTVVNDTATTYQGNEVTKAVLANDTVVGATTLAFKSTGQPSGVVLSNSNKTATKSGQGVWQINDADDTVTFTPEDSFTGTAAAVIITVTDTGGSADGTLTVTVTAALDLSGLDRTYGVDVEGRRTVTFTLESSTAAGATVDADSLGLTNVEHIHLDLPPGANAKYPNLDGLSSGLTVTFAGA